VRISRDAQPQVQVEAEEVKGEEGDTDRVGRGAVGEVVLAHPLASCGVLEVGLDIGRLCARLQLDAQADGAQAERQCLGALRERAGAAVCGATGARRPKEGQRAELAAESMAEHGATLVGRMRCEGRRVRWRERRVR
jgi:hypothetical protein